MMRQVYRFCPRTGRMVDRDGFPMLSHNELAHDESQIRCPQVMRDIQEYASPIDDRPITSRSWRREDLKRNNCIEVDPPKRPRGFKNPAWAKKYGKRVNEHCDARNIEAEKKAIAAIPR